jgi:hypothetical protein
MVQNPEQDSGMVEVEVRREKREGRRPSDFRTDEISENRPG